MRITNAAVLALGLIYAPLSNANDQLFSTIDVSLPNQTVIKAQIMVKAISTPYPLEPKVQDIDQPYAVINGNQYGISATIPAYRTLCELKKLGVYVRYEALTSEEPRGYAPMVVYDKETKSWSFDENSAYHTRTYRVRCDQREDVYTGGGTTGDGHGDNAHGGDT